MKAEISKLEDDEKKELGKVLTDAQREELKRIIASQAFSEPPKEEPKKKSGDK